MVRVLPVARFAEHTDDRPVVLSGPPEALTGRVSVTNPTDQRVVVRTGALTGFSAEKDSAPVSLTAILEPGGKSTVTARARMDTGTPPGTYRGKLTLGGHDYPAVIHVLENVSLELTPQRIDLIASPGESVTKSVSITNHGNVPLPIGPIAAVALDDERMNCRTIRATLRKGSGSVTDINGWLTTLCETANELLDEMGLLGVQVQGGATTVAPGTTVLTELKLRVPDNLQPGTRYFGAAPICDADLEFCITPIGRREVSLPATTTTRQAETKKKGRT